MATRGRPPKPTEVKRRTGNPGKRPLPEPSNVVALPMASGVPEPPADLGLEGRRLWERVWQAGITWISPTTDMLTVEQACQAADDVAIARRRYHATSDPADARALKSLTDSLHGWLSALGFDPTARTRLGVAEVTRVSKLDALRRRSG